MYSKHEVSLLTQQFWTSFGQYIAPVFSADGEKINWINYKTGQKDIRFIMASDSKGVKISITLSHRDVDVQQQCFDQLLQLKKILQQITGEQWLWEPLTTNQYGKIISEVFITLHNVQILNKADWPAIISFFKTRMILLDKFWCQYKYVLE